MNASWLRKAHSKRRKSWPGSAHKTCIPAFQKPNSKNLRAGFEEEWCNCNLRLKRRRLNKSKHYPFELENAVKTAIFSMEFIFERDFRKIYTAFKKPRAANERLAFSRTESV